MSDDILNSPEEVLSTLNADGTRKWIYPTVSKGKWWKRRAVVAYILILLFIAMPLIKINGRPAMLFDIFTWKFSLFGLLFSPTDTELLMVFGLSLFAIILLVTALFGRVWCGWGCPQTVYLEFIYRPVEELIEGKPAKRRRTDGKRLDGKSIFKKILKWGVFVLISFGLSHVFVAYLVGWERLGSFIFQSPFDHPSLFGLMAGMSAMILFDFGSFREQMCTIACPYARMQSVLQDRESMIVSYDPNRGEPRGKKRKDPNLELGDCIDCNACVRTCPTGIDIRKGLQMECVGCLQCVDACDEIMIKVNRPVGLIRYSSENEIEKKKTKLIRPRTIFYFILSVISISVLGILISSTEPISVKVFRTGGAPFVKLEKGITNSFKVRIENRTTEPKEIRFVAHDSTKMKLLVVGGDTHKLKPGQFKKVFVRSTVQKNIFEGGKAEVTLDLITEGLENKPVILHLVGPK